MTRLHEIQVLQETAKRRQLEEHEEARLDELIQFEAMDVPERRCPVIGNRADLSRIVNDRDEEGNLVLLPEELFELVPWGHRLLIVREKPIAVTPGGIIIPEPAKREMTTGWVVSIGDRVGVDDSFSTAYPGISPFNPPEGLIGQRVTFAKHAGQALFPKRDSIGGTGYESRFTLMTDGDIYFHYHAATPQENAT